MTLPLADHVVRIWRRTVTLGAQREEVVTYQIVLDAPARPNARVPRSVTRVARDGPGLTPVGVRRIYLAAGTDLQPRDLVELVTGPEAPAWLEVDSEVVRPRGHHVQADCRPWKGPPPITTSGNFVSRTVSVQVPRIRITRPSNTVPYTAGDVYGHGGDARIAIPVPALLDHVYLLEAVPTSLFTMALQVRVFRHRDPLDVPSQWFNFIKRPRQPFTTVLGDNQPLVLSDEEIDDVVWGGGSFGSQTLNFTDRIIMYGAGKTGLSHTQGPAELLEVGEPVRGGDTLGLYLQLAEDYTPLASEVVDLYPAFVYAPAHYFHLPPGIAA